MSIEAQPQIKSLTPGQEVFSRLLTKEGRARRQPGDRFKSMAINAFMGTAAAGGEIGEAMIFNKVLNWVMPNGTHGETVMKKIKNTKKYTQARVVVPNPTSPEKSAVEFMEEWGSDKAIEAVGNAFVKTLTGSDESYVTPVSAFLSDWANTIAQVFYSSKQTLFVIGDKETGFKVKMKDVINPFDVEAAFRVTCELPGGSALQTVLDRVSEKLDRSPVAMYANGVAAQGILGYHIQNTLLKETGQIRYVRKTPQKK